jgi:hypothetical protein
MEIMRHSDMRLTAKTYTDAGLLPIAEAVLNLPSHVKPIVDSQIDSQNLFRAGQAQSGPVTKSAKIKRLRVTGQHQSSLVMKRERMGRTGFEHSNLGIDLETAATCKLGLTRRLTKSFRPHFGPLVAAWPHLSKERKEIVGSLLETV